MVKKNVYLVFSQLKLYILNYFLWINWPEVTLDDLDLIIQEYNKEIVALVNKLPTKIKFYKYKYMILFITNYMKHK